MLLWSENTKNKMTQILRRLNVIPVPKKVIMSANGQIKSIKIGVDFGKLSVNN